MKDIDNRLNMWIVHDRPLDYPTSFVARRWIIDKAAIPTVDVKVAPTLEELRALLPEGLYCLPRDPNDEPKIVEVWM